MRWVDNQQHRWGSCTPENGTIRISTRLKGLPEWVINYVIIHELVHLLVPSHGPRFWALVEQYPKAERARGFLEGFSAAAHDGTGGMLTRIVAVLVRQSMARSAPPRRRPAARSLEAVAEDTYEMVAGLELVTPVLVTSVPGLDEIVWPGTEVISIDEDEPLKEHHSAGSAATRPR